jgi:hypothetical protein
MGMIKWDRGLGITLMIVSLPAVMRTMQIARRLGAKGTVLSFSEKLLAFGHSLVVVTLVAGGAGGTLCGIIYLLSNAIAGSTIALGLWGIFMEVILVIGISGSVGAALIQFFWRPRE